MWGSRNQTQSCWWQAPLPTSQPSSWPSSVFSLLITLLETEYTLILIKFNFSFPFGAHVLVYFICLVLTCYITFVVCVCMCVLCAVLSAMAHLWKAENKFHQMGPGAQTWVLRLLSGCLYPLSHDQPTSWWENWNEPIIKSKDIKMQPYVFFQ